MRKISFPRVFIPLLVAAGSVLVHSTPAQADPTGTETLGRARFSIITPNVVRLEDGTFVDAPSLFAANRTTRFTKYKTKRDGNALTIDTGALRLHYTNDAKPFSPENLNIEVRQDKGWTKWTPGQQNTGNLGGPIATLDGVVGPVRLSEGLLSRNGWALVDDSKRPLLTTDWVQARPQTAGTDWYFFGYGRDFKAAFQGLTAISGGVPMPRRYTLGTWFSRFWPFTSAEYRSIMKEYEEHDFPLDVMVMDMDWHRDGWTGWSWNRQLLPDAEQLLRDFHAHNLAVTLNLHPADGVRPYEDAYPQFMRALGKNPASRETVPFDAASKPYMDALFEQVHAPFEKEGVDFWWVDWQQTRQTRSIPSLTNLEWLNHLYFNWTGRDTKRGVSFSRWGGWGDQRYPIHFSGDSDTRWSMLAFEVPFTAASGNAGCFFWSHDIGGHRGGRNEESYTRWCQFGALSAALRSHSERDESTDRRPWKYPKWAEESMRRSFHLRSELFPYIYSSVRQTSAQTIPLVRPMYFDYPNLESAYTNAQEYTFGDSLLVAPIATPGNGASRTASQVVWMPPGQWFDWFTGEKFTSSGQGRSLLASADINTFPVYARGGMPIPMQPYSARPATAPLSRLVVRCYPGEEGRTQTFPLYEDDGVSTGYKKGEFAVTDLSARRQGNVTSITIAPVRGQYPGQLQSRVYSIELPATRPATRVRVDGQTVQARYDEARGCNIIEVPTRSIRNGASVQVTAALIPETELHNKAQRMRWSAIAGKPVQNMNEIQATDTSQDTAILASMGIGMYLKNDAPYFYGGKDELRFYAPAGIAPIKATIGIGSARGDTMLVSGQKIVLDNLKGAMAPRDTIFVPGRDSVTLTFPYAGRTWTLSQKLDEPFGGMTATGDSENLARRAKLEASSTDEGGGYRLSGATDGVASGYPGVRSYEWSSNQQKVGASITLRWDAPVTVARALLYDRPNMTDNVTSAKITFSDGSSVDVGALPNDGQTPAEVTFAPRQVTWAKIEITGVLPDTENAGFSEVGFFAR